MGCAFLDSTSNTACMYKLPNEASAYTAEAIAILKALEYIKNINYSNRYLICSDSASVLEAIKGFPKKNVASYLIFEIIKLIISLKLNNIPIVSLWIPGHSNVQGNEQVDRLANTASVTGNSLDIDLPMGMSTLL